MYNRMPSGVMCHTAYCYWQIRWRSHSYANQYFIYTTSAISGLGPLSGGNVPPSLKTSDDVFATHHMWAHSH